MSFGGLTPALSRLAANAGSNPLGMAVWVNSIAAILCLSYAFYRGKLPRLGMREIFFFLSWAIIAGIVQRLVTFWVTEHVEAATLSLIVTLQGFMVFSFGLDNQIRQYRNFIDGARALGYKI